MPPPKPQPSTTYLSPPTRQAHAHAHAPSTSEKPINTSTRATNSTCRPSYASSYASNISSFYDSDGERTSRGNSRRPRLDDVDFDFDDDIGAQGFSVMDVEMSTVGDMYHREVRNLQESHSRALEKGKGKGKERSGGSTTTGTSTTTSALTSTTGDDVYHDTTTSCEPFDSVKTAERKDMKISAGDVKSAKVGVDQSVKTRKESIDRNPKPKHQTQTHKAGDSERRPRVDLIGEGKMIEGQPWDPQAALHDQQIAHRQGVRNAAAFITAVPSEFRDPDSISRRNWPDHAFSGVGSDVINESPSIIRPRWEGSSLFPVAEVEVDDEREKEFCRQMILRDFNKRCIAINAEADRAKRGIDSDVGMTVKQKDLRKTHIERLRLMRIDKAKEESGYSDVDNAERIAKALLSLGRSDTSDIGNDTTLVKSDEITQRPGVLSPYPYSSTSSTHDSVARWVITTAWMVVKFCLAIPTDPMLKTTSLPENPPVFLREQLILVETPARSSSLTGAARSAAKTRTPSHDQSIQVPGESGSRGNIVHDSDREARNARATSQAVTEWPSNSVMYQTSSDSGVSHVGWSHLNSGAVRSRRDTAVKVNSIGTNSGQYSDSSLAASANDRQTSSDPGVRTLRAASSGIGTQWPDQSHIYEQSMEEASSRAQTIIRQISDNREREEQKANRRALAQAQAVVAQRMSFCTSIG